MKQQVNLYYIEKEKNKIQLTSRELIAIYVIFLSVLLVATIVNTYKHFTNQKELFILTNERLKKTQQLQILSGQVPLEQTRNQIMEEIKKLEAEKKDREEIVSQLEMAQSKKTSGYSEYIESIARETTPGLWLTKFSFKDNGDNITLEGQTLNPEAVPKLISNLSRESIFKSKTFEVFKMSLDEKTKQVNFTLETKRLQPHPQ